MIGEDFVGDGFPEIDEREVLRRRMRRDRLVAARKAGSHTDTEWRMLLAEFGGRCVHCGEVVPLVKDHIVPLYLGGSDAIENLQPVCAKYNGGKGSDRTDWKAYRRTYGF